MRVVACRFVLRFLVPLTPTTGIVYFLETRGIPIPLEMLVFFSDNEESYVGIEFLRL